MSKQPRNLRNLNAAAQLSTGTVGNASEPARRTVPATPPEPPPRLLPVRALGEYVPGGRVDTMRRLIRGR